MNKRKKPTIVVYGPMGCGKTRNAQRLLRALNRSHLIDEGLDFVPGRMVPVHDALVLTNDEARAAPAGCIRMSFQDAMRRAGSA